MAKQTPINRNAITSSKLQNTHPEERVDSIEEVLGPPRGRSCSHLAQQPLGILLFALRAGNGRNVNTPRRLYKMDMRWMSEKIHLRNGHHKWAVKSLSGGSIPDVLRKRLKRFWRFRREIFVVLRETRTGKLRKGISEEVLNKHQKEICCLAVTSGWITHFFYLLVYYVSESGQS